MTRPDVAPRRPSSPRSWSPVDIGEASLLRRAHGAGHGRPRPGPSDVARAVPGPQQGCRGEGDGVAAGHDWHERHGRAGASMAGRVLQTGTIALRSSPPRRDDRRAEVHRRHALGVMEAGDVHGGAWAPLTTDSPPVSRTWPRLRPFGRAPADRRALRAHGGVRPAYPEPMVEAVPPRGLVGRPDVRAPARPGERIVARHRFHVFGLPFLEFSYRTARKPTPSPTGSRGSSGMSRPSVQWVARAAGLAPRLSPPPLRAVRGAA